MDQATTLQFTTDAAEPELSIVVPLYNEEDNVRELYDRLKAALDLLWQSYQIVFVNDGSSDATGQLLDECQSQDSRLTVIHLSRNFGHQPAISAGLEHAAGQAVILMDGDLQDPPEALGQFVEKWRQGFDVVYAVRTKRKEGLAKRLGYAAFYRLLRAVSDLDIPLDSGDFCLMDRKVVDVLNHLPEKLRFVRGLRTFAGFSQVGLEYERAARSAGQSKYSFRALLKLALDGLISFSNYPLNLVTHLGLASAGLALLAAIWVVADVLLNNATPRGWASTIIVVLFMSAIQLLSLGIIGEYIRRIFHESKGRPTYIIREVQSRVPAPTLNQIDASDGAESQPTIGSPKRITG